VSKLLLFIYYYLLICLNANQKSIRLTTNDVKCYQMFRLWDYEKIFFLIIKTVNQIIGRADHYLFSLSGISAT